MSPTPEIKPEDCHFISLAAFSRAENVSLRTLNRRKVKDAKFPAPRFGKKFWRPDLLAYLYGIKS
jgi:hypothetical protein